jgi:hypothetical protein
MLFVVWIPLLFQLVTPLGLLMWLAFSRPAVELAFALQAVCMEHSSYWIRMIFPTDGTPFRFRTKSV